MLCACPPAASIVDIPVDVCIENIGQIQKFGLQRRKTGSAYNWIDITSTNPNLLATWTALKTSADSTKVQFSPFIQEPTSEAGEAIEFGGGNQTVSGIPIIVGRNASTFSAAFLRVKQTIIKEIKKFECETELGVFAERSWSDHRYRRRHDDSDAGSSHSHSFVLRQRQDDWRV